MAETVGGRFKHFMKEWVKPIVIVLIIVGSFRSTFADWNDVPTGSMKPTILEGERIFVNKLAYDLKVPFAGWRVAIWGNPKRGDIVVLFSPADGRRLVKRVVGLPGDRIAMVNNRLVINGRPVAYEPVDPELAAELLAGADPEFVVESERLDAAPHSVMFDSGYAPARSFRPVVVPDGQYFVLGDNRDNSFDSRWFGFVRRNRIVGRATAVVVSVDLERHWRPRWHRFLRGLS
jgi:signal peptidase I